MVHKQAVAQNLNSKINQHCVSKRCRNRLSKWQVHIIYTIYNITCVHQTAQDVSENRSGALTPTYINVNVSFVPQKNV